MSTPCYMDAHCRNSPSYKGEAFADCAYCRLSPDNLGREMAQYWNPIERSQKHPQLLAEKKDNKIAKALAKLSKKRGRDLAKRQTLRKASLAEKQTERSIIKSTINSGRLNRDGDHLISNSSITLDTKNQSTRKNPIIYLHELTKVQHDAKNAGRSMGVLVLRNSEGVGVVAIAEEDFARIVSSYDKPGIQAKD